MRDRVAAAVAPLEARLGLVLVGSQQHPRQVGHLGVGVVPQGLQGLPHLAVNTAAPQGPRRGPQARDGRARRNPPHPVRRRRLCGRRQGCLWEAVHHRRGQDCAKRSPNASSTGVFFASKKVTATVAAGKNMTFLRHHPDEIEGPRMKTRRSETRSRYPTGHLLRSGGGTTFPPKATTDPSGVLRGCPERKPLTVAGDGQELDAVPRGHLLHRRWRAICNKDPTPLQTPARPRQLPGRFCRLKRN